MLCNYLVKDLDTTFWDKLQYCSGNRDLDDGDPTIYIYIYVPVYSRKCAILLQYSNMHPETTYSSMFSNYDLYI